MTRLKSLFVKDFRSINGEVEISLDAPIVLIHGPNGAGKTSLLTAIELALTGSVPSLSRAEPDYLAYLPHKGSPFGEVRLVVEGDDGTIRSSEVRVTTSTVNGNPLLSGIEASFFTERSYLAQSTLGRLLEIYQHADKKTDSPLTRFVKELLGLDRMEALISGLHTAGNISRLKGPVPAYANVRDRIQLDESEVDTLTNEVDDAATAITMLKNSLTQRIALFDSTLSEIDPSELIVRLTAVSEEADLRTLVRVRRELAVSQASWASGASVGPDGGDRNSIEAANKSARSAFERWNFEHGKIVEELLARASRFFADTSVSSESNFVDRARVLGERIATDHKRAASVLTAHDAALQRRDDLAKQLEAARTRLERIDQEVSTASTANEAFARALSDLTSHIDGDNCPVCDRDFSEVSDVPLASHLAAKIAGMVEQAGRLQSLLQARTGTQTDAARLDRDMQAAASGLVSEAELTALKARAADLTEVARQLAELKPQLEEGDRYRDQAAHSAQALVALQNADQSAVVLRNGIEDLARRIGFTAGAAMPTEELLQHITTLIEQRESALMDRQANRREAVETAQSLVAALDAREKLIGKLSKLEGQLAKRKSLKTAADRMIDQGKDIARQAREARGRVVRRVFNDELNAVWRDLFVRLAPEEPFIPAFAIPDTAAADVEAVLETHHRRGGKGGNPRAMLSAGNLNTAALTLFLALHLSVSPKLPWLIIDDPVQSMDEVHIAQFAALLRTLSKQVKRQVIVAVHERSLFDYLALELSPAFEGDRLNLVELGRSSIGQTTCRWDPRQYVADRAVAA
ncbi:MAG TPA: AAA family ATPase [Tardiphaga sp.]